MPEPIMKAYAQPTPGDVHVNKPLTNLSIAYMQSQDNFVARRAFPIVSSDHMSDRYYVYDVGTFNRDSMKKRAAGAETAEITHELSDTAFTCDVWGVHENVADQSVSNQDSIIDLENDAMELVSRAGLIRYEREFASTAFKDATWSLNVDGAGTRSPNFDPTGTAANDVLYWNNEASTPIEDIEQLIDRVGEATGYRPNVLTLGRRVWTALKHHVDIVGRVDRGQTTGTAKVTQAAVADLFEIDELQVMDAIYNSAKEGATTKNQYITGKSALLHYRADSPGRKKPSSGYTFVWNAYAGLPEGGARIKTFRQEENAALRVEGEIAFKMVVTGKDLGAYFKNIVQ